MSAISVEKNKHITASWLPIELISDQAAQAGEAFWHITRLSIQVVSIGRAKAKHVAAPVLQSVQDLRHSS